jgi:hypothetical protein
MTNTGSVAEDVGVIWKYYRNAGYIYGGIGGVVVAFALIAFAYNFMQFIP